MKKKKRRKYVKKSKSKYTLNQLGKTVDKLVMTVSQLAKIVSDGFSELRQDVKSLKQDVIDINARLDYIVKANNLKDYK